MTMEQLALELLGLPAKDRASLAEKLIASLEEEMEAGGVDALWAEEAERRLKQVEDGKASVRSADEVIHAARSRLKRRSSSSSMRRLRPSSWTPPASTNHGRRG